MWRSEERKLLAEANQLARFALSLMGELLKDNIELLQVRNTQSFLVIKCPKGKTIPDAYQDQISAYMGMPVLICEQGTDLALIDREAMRKAGWIPANFQ